MKMVKYLVVWKEETWWAHAWRSNPELYSSTLGVTLPSVVSVFTILRSWGRNVYHIHLQIAYGSSSARSRRKSVQYRTVCCYSRETHSIQSSDTIPGDTLQAFHGALLSTVGPIVELAHFIGIVPDFVGSPILPIVENLLNFWQVVDVLVLTYCFFVPLKLFKHGARTL